MKNTKQSSLGSVLGNPTGPVPVSLFAKPAAKSTAKAKTFSPHGTARMKKPVPTR